MPDVSYSYKVRLGPYTWTGDGGDMADYGPVDGLEIIRKVIDSDLWPTAEDVAECRFQLVLPNTAYIAGVEVGTPVVVEYDSPAVGSITSPLESFYGRVAELTSQPHELGVLYNVSCLDYTADLRELPVGGAVDYPAEDVKARVDRIMTEAGLTVTYETFAGQPPEPAPALDARTKAATTVYELVESYLAQWPAFYEAPVGTFHGPFRPYLTPTLNASDELSGWLVRFINPDITYRGPLRLELVGGLWTAVGHDGHNGEVVVDGGEVDFSSNYAITKQGSVSRVSISGPPGTVTADLGVTPAVTAAMDNAELSSLADMATLAAMYLPADLATSKWVADAFLWRLELVTDPTTLALGAELPELRQLVTVAPVEATQNPTTDAWHAGQLTGYTFTIVDRRPTYLFTLRRPVFSTENGDVITWASEALTTQAVTWNTLNPADTWDDYRLVRGTVA